jgi:hypothetical protein
VLNAAIAACFYVGGNLPETASVNGYFFAVNAGEMLPDPWGKSYLVLLLLNIDASLYSRPYNNY